MFSEASGCSYHLRGGWHALLEMLKCTCKAARCRRGSHLAKGAANAAAGWCPSSGTGDNAAALRVLRGPLDPCRNSTRELLPAGCDLVWSGLALIWEGVPVAQPREFGVRKELLQSVCLMQMMATRATLQILVCPSSHHRWSPPLLIIPPGALAPLIFSSFAIFKGSSCIFPSSSHPSSQQLCAGSVFQQQLQ